MTISEELEIRRNITSALPYARGDRFIISRFQAHLLLESKAFNIKSKYEWSKALNYYYARRYGTKWLNHGEDWVKFQLLGGHAALEHLNYINK